MSKQKSLIMKEQKQQNDIKFHCRKNKSRGTGRYNLSSARRTNSEKFKNFHETQSVKKFIRQYFLKATIDTLNYFTERQL